MLEFYGAFCYSNQQTDWAYDLGRELLDNYGSIWGYLFGDGDFPDLSLSAGNLIKSANLFVGLGGMFVVEGAEFGCSCWKFGYGQFGFCLLDYTSNYIFL